MSTTRKALLVAPRDRNERLLMPSARAMRTALNRQATDGRGVMPAREDAVLPGTLKTSVAQDLPYADPTGDRASNRA